jgi:DNA topoisomerase I
MFRSNNNEELPEKTVEVAAQIAEEGLRYVTDTTPGYRLKRTGTSFSYHDKNGTRITNKDIIRRIKSIGIPPAYDFVWICPSPNGHIQATGLDAKGRKQYRYHPTSNIAIIRNGASFGIRTSTNISCNSRPACRSYADASRRT